MVRKLVIAGAFGAAAFVASGPLQHLGLLPETAFGSASKETIKAALGIGVAEAWGSCGGWRSKGNNGFGNGGLDGVPGGSNHQDRTR